MMVMKMCNECDKVFSVLPRHREQKRCPECIARGDFRINSVPLRRKLLYNQVVEIGSLPPSEWRDMPPKRPHDEPYYKLDFFGRDLIKGWADDPPQGRIVINASRPYEPGDVVRCRVVRVLHDTKDGNQEVREYMSLYECDSDFYPVGRVEWDQGEYSDYSAQADWCFFGNSGFKECVAGDTVGQLRLVPILEEEE